MTRGNGRGLRSGGIRPRLCFVQRNQRHVRVIGKLKTVPGKRDALISILIEGVSGMPGCLGYIVAQDPTDPDAIWVTEAWDSQASHQASMSLPSVKEAIARGKPLIAGFGERFETKPIGGQGIGSNVADAAGR